MKQAIGHWWTAAQTAAAGTHGDVWHLRRQQVAQIVQHQGGQVRAADLTNVLGLPRRTASLWLQRLAEEGFLQPEKPQRRTTRYMVR